MNDILANINMDNINQGVFIENENLEDILSDINIDLNMVLPPKDDTAYSAPEGAIPGYHYFEIVLFDLFAIGYSPTLGVQFILL